MVPKGWVKPSSSLAVGILFLIHRLIRYRHDYYMPQVIIYLQPIRMRKFTREERPMGGRKDKEKREKALEDQRAVRRYGLLIPHCYPITL